MKYLNRVWDYCESNLFGYRFKRLSASVGLLFFIQAGSFLGMFFIFANFSASGPDALEGAKASAMRGFLAVGVTGIALSAVSTWLLWQMIAYLAAKPLRVVNALMHSLADGRNDMSQNIDALPYPELGQVAHGYNAFIGNIRHIIENIRSTAMKIAINSSKVHKAVALTSAKTDRQKELSEMVSFSSSDANEAIKEVSKNTQHVSDNTHSNLEKARRSFNELLEVETKIEQINRTVNSFKKIVQELNSNSKSIIEIVALINNISEETNLLSLNATIEAARAGEHGRGFAVVADEVRTLAKRVKPATVDITDKVRKMVSSVEQTLAQTDGIIKSGADVGGIIHQTSTSFKSIMNAFEDTGEQMLRIAAAVEELTRTNEAVNQKVGEINVFASEIFSDMEDSAKKVQGLNETTEKMQEMVAYYSTGQGVLDQVISKARRYRDYMQVQIGEMKQKGIDVFDKNYKPIPNTNPQKFTTGFTAMFKKAFQTYIDEILNEIPGAIYAVPLDTRGYLSVHHTHVSKPVTGDFENDSLYSRDCRFYSSSNTEKKRAANTSPMLLQTYMRDTGEILVDLSLPILIDGKHWGAWVMGIKPETFYNEG
jgi:methyl-accepting chemotaxis protein